MSKFDHGNEMKKELPFIPPVAEISDLHMWERLLNLEDDRAATAGMAQRLLTQHRQLYRTHGADRVIPPLAGENLATWLLTHLARQEEIVGLPGACVGGHFIAVQFAPQGLTSGAVLQNAAHPANCHEPLAALLHAIHGQRIGNGKLENNHSVLYRKFLDQCHVVVPDIHSSRFAASAEFFPLAWALPVYRLSLSLFPEAQLGGILGAALFEFGLGVPPLLRASAVSVMTESAYFKAHCATGPDPIVTQMTSAIALALALSERPHLLSEQICEGFFHSMWLYEAWARDVRAHLAGGGQAPHDAMVALVKRKGRFAVGYHGKLKLDHQPFDSLIVADPEAFVSALAGSRWIVPGQPQSSLLLVKLIQFGGPMFRVFSESEITVIEQWVSSLELAQPKVPGAPAPHLTPMLVPEQDNRTLRARPASNARVVYHQLLNLAAYPDAMQDALDYALTWLARSAEGIAGDVHAIPLTSYSHEGLVAWFEQKALEQVNSYTLPNGAIEKTREAVIDEALQLCPMILVDGAWLQRWGNAGLAESPIGALLFKIFSDEIGNGDTALNHPNIYRALMSQMGITLPDFRSLEFSQWARFDDGAFSVPAFWLSLSHFPRRFLPETLGLNLSMELSGVGGAYRSARDELRHFGFSTAFVDLHNTIDNVSTGHSAMALEAIQLYMDGIISLCDRRVVATHWQRIRVGYCALAEPRQRWRDLIIKPRYPFYSHIDSANSARGNR